MDRKSFIHLHQEGQTSFQEANLLGIDLSNLELNGIDLRKANLKAANLSNTKLRYSDLRGADLTMANLCNTDLTFARLAEANLTGVNHDLGYFEGYKYEYENYQKDSQSQDQFLTQEFEAIKAELESASCQIENLQNNEIRLLQKAESLEKEVEDLKAELKKKEQDINQSQVKYEEDLEKQLCQVRADLSQSNQRLSELRLENTQLIQNLKNSEINHSKLAKEVEGVNLGKQKIVLRNFKIGVLALAILLFTSVGLLIYTKFSVLQTLQTIKRERDTAITNKNTAITNKNTAITNKNTAIAEKNIAITNKNTAIAERNTAIAEKNTAITQRDAARREFEKFALFENNSIEYEGDLSSNNTDTNAVFYSFYVPEKATLSIIVEAVEASENLNPQFGVIVGNDHNSTVYCPSSGSIDCNISSYGLHQIKLWNISDKSGRFKLTIRKKSPENDLEV
ncbi:MAG: hypothetical protein EAZ77_05440 [Nostocales cyanobacterium]|nr:MAG: hypothetical protein EAZ77_05440 [Nostocales cyanobacterium]